MKFTYFIDGDQIRVQELIDARYIQPSDEVWVFSDVNHIAGFRKRYDKITETLKCPVHLIEVKAGNNAVDFAIAMYSVVNWDRTGLLIFVSDDKHFQSIASNYISIYPAFTGMVKVVKYLSDSEKYFGWLRTGDLYSALCRYIGESNAKEIMGEKVEKKKGNNDYIVAV